VPEKVVTNEDFSKIVDTNDEWITTRTGIKERHFCEEETNWQLAYVAANKAIINAGINKDDIGILVVGTFTPDYATPSVACILQKELGLSENIMAFDVNAACSGFLYSLKIANALLETSDKTYALVIGSEQISTRLNMEDRGSCVLFGDGAGAIVIKHSPDKKFYSVLKAKGDYEALGCNGITSDKPYIYMEGKSVFKNAVHNMTEVTNEVLKEAGLTLENIDYVVCHQANERIIRAVIKQLKAPEEKFFINIAKYGNTSAASIPIALDEMNEAGLLTAGKKIICVGFGAGFTWGATLIEL
jgi:3-oxoacyl-[acyl-carrier-protein] synthase-3